MSVQLADKMTLDEFTKWLKDDQSFRQDMIDSICSILDADWAPLNRQLGGYRVTFKEMPERARTVKAALEQSVEHEASMSMLLFQLNLAGGHGGGEKDPNRILRFDEGFPELKKIATISEASIPTNEEHAKVKPVLHDIGTLDDATWEKIKAFSSGIGPVGPDEKSTSGTYTYASETCIAHIVRACIERLVGVLGLPAQIISEVEVWRRRPDLWIITLQGEPIGSVEVKKPAQSSDKGMDHPNVLGEVYDAVMQLAHFSGCMRGIAILIDGRFVRVCWVGDDIVPMTENEDPLESQSGSDSAVQVRPASLASEPGAGGADSDTVADKKKSSGRKQTSPGPRIEEGVFESEVMLECEEVDRKLFVSPIRDLTDPSNIGMRTIGAALCKMMKTSRSPFEHPFDARRTTFLVYHKKKDYILWMKRPKDFEGKWGIQRKLHTCETLYSVANMGQGRDHRVHLTSTESGYLHVLKFWIENTKDTVPGLRNQHDAWNFVYPQYEVAIETWSGMQCLRMPYFRAIPVAHRTKSMNAVKEALDHFVSKGVMHTDVRWCNMGLSREGKVVLYDLDIRKITDSDENWVSNAIASLAASEE
eukprot:m.353756 g.353756  ORF g.353756 m.353756 type:complete len:590 (+) comp16593_c2_seq27:577-2346(+)